MGVFRLKVRDYAVGGRHFVLGKLDEVYVAIEDKYLDENGCMNTTLNGIQMHVDKTLEGCMERTSQQVKVDALVEQGVDPLDAIRQVILG